MNKQPLDKYPQYDKTMVVIPDKDWQIFFEGHTYAMCIKSSTKPRSKDDIVNMAKTHSYIAVWLKVTKTAQWVKDKVMKIIFNPNK